MAIIVLTYLTYLTTSSGGSIVYAVTYLGSYHPELLGITDPFGSSGLPAPASWFLLGSFRHVALVATRTVLSRVVLDPRARHRALLRREAGQAGVFVPSRARERKAAWKASYTLYLLEIRVVGHVGWGE